MGDSSLAFETAASSLSRRSGGSVRLSVGDIFANTQPTIGDVHNADVQTFVPIFHDDDGRKYLLNQLWDHRPGGNRFAGIVAQENSVAEQRLIGRREAAISRKQSTNSFVLRSS